MNFPPQDDASFSADEWAQYGIDLLRQYMPQESKLINKINIVVNLSPKPRAEADHAAKTIIITKGRILPLESEGEYITLLAHELGHIKKKHVSVISYAYMCIPWGMEHVSWWLTWRLRKLALPRSTPPTFEEYLFAIETKMEIEADKFMIDNLPPELNAASVFADSLLRLGGVPESLDQPLHPCTKMHLERIRILKQTAREATKDK